jgi:hypothetical protein
MKTTKLPRAPALQRRDGAGHINPDYAADLLARGRDGKEEDAAPFLKGPGNRDAVAEELGEEFVETVTGAQDEGQDVLDRKTPEEDGGPFVETTAGTEFASGTDESNLKEATREPFPTT